MRPATKPTAGTREEKATIGESGTINNNDWKGGKNNDWNGGGQGGGKGGYGGTTFGGVQGGSSSYGGGGQGGGFGFGGNYDGSGFGTAQSMYGGMGGGMKGGMMGGVANAGECYSVRVYGWCGKQVCQWKHKPGSHFPGQTFNEDTQKYLATVIQANRMMEQAGSGGGGGGGNDWQNRSWGGGKRASDWNDEWGEGDWNTTNKKKKSEKKKKKKTPTNAKGKGKGKGKKADPGVEEHEMEDEDGDLTGTFEACEDLAAYVGYATKLCLEQSKTDEFTETSHVLDEGRAEWFERMVCWFADGTKKGPKKLLALMEPDIIEVFKNSAGLDFGIDKRMQEIVGNLAKFNNPAEAGKKVCKLVGARTTCVEADLPRLIVMLTYMEMRYNGPLAWDENFDEEEDTEEEEEEEWEEEEEDDL
eukprot:g2500.t1